MNHFIKKNIWIGLIFLITLILGFLTFLTFIDKSFLKLTDNNLQFLLIGNIALLLIFFYMIFKEFLTSENIIKKRSINNAIFPINKIWRLLSDSLKKLLSINVKKVIKPMNKVIKNIIMMNIFFLIKSIIVDKIMCYIFLS